MGADLIREARRRAGITQAELARRAGTTQSSVARWESGRTSPSFDTVVRLIRLCGFGIDVHLEPWDGSDLAQSLRLLELTPAERLDSLEHITRFVEEGRRVFAAAVGA